MTWVKTNYEDPKQLNEIMRGVHTVLSFITAHMDPGSVAQKGLIDAAVRAGVKRFAPSEWAMYVVTAYDCHDILQRLLTRVGSCRSKFDHMPWNEGKGVIREYLKELNKEKKAGFL